MLPTVGRALAGHEERFEEYGDACRDEEHHVKLLHLEETQLIAYGDFIFETATATAHGKGDGVTAAPL